MMTKPTLMLFFEILRESAEKGRDEIFTFAVFFVVCC